MLSYRKLAMHVLGRPLPVKEGIPTRPAAHRAAAFALTAAMMVALTAPAFAGTYFIGDGDITVEVKADGSGVTVTDSMGTHDDTLEDVAIRGGSAKDTMEAKDTPRAIAISGISDEVTYPAPTILVSEPEGTDAAPEEPQPEEAPGKAEVLPAAPASFKPVTEEPDGDAALSTPETPASENAPAAPEVKDAVPEKSFVSSSVRRSQKDEEERSGVTYESRTPAQTAAKTISDAVDNIIKIINNTKETLKVTLEGVSIDATGRNEAALSVTGSGDTTIELDGNNLLQGDERHAGLEHAQTTDSSGNVTSGGLTIQDDNDTTGSLTAIGGDAGAGIGGGDAQAGEVTITGGTIQAVGGEQGAGIGGGCGDAGNTAGNADITITGGTITAIGGGTPSSGGAGIGGGVWGNANVTISGSATIEDATGKTFASGIGGGAGGTGNVTIEGEAVVENAQGGDGGAGIGGGQYDFSHGNGGDGTVTIRGNAKLDTVTGGYGAAGIGSGLLGTATVTISDNAEIGNAQGGAAGAGIGSGYGERADVTIEGGTTVNATGGAGGAGIGGSYGAENDNEGNGNKITIRSNGSGSPNVSAKGGLSDETVEIEAGGAGIGSGVGDANADITIEGKVTIVATAGDDNSAIGANGVEQDFTGLEEGSSITRYDAEGNDITLPSDPGHALPDDSDDSDSGEASAVPAEPDSMLSGLIVTDASGRRISYTSIRGNSTLTVRASRFSASLHTTLGALRALRAEGIETITFRTLLRSSTLSLDALLAMGGDDTTVVLTHRVRSSKLTVGGSIV